MEFSDVYKKIIEYNNIQTKCGYIEAHSLNVPKNKRHCIFCGKQASETKFSDDAHAISEVLGNKQIITHFECDKCNNIFGSTIEDALGKYITPFNFISGNFGKKKSLTVKDMPKKETLAFGSYRMERSQKYGALDESNNPLNYIIEQSGCGKFEEIEGGFKLTIPRQKYIPELVYLALLKIAYNIMPLNELKEYCKSIVTLKAFAYKEYGFECKEEQIKYFNSIPPKGLISFFFGTSSFNGVNAALYKSCLRNEPQYPRMLLQVDFYNFSIVIPVLSDCQHENYKLIKPIYASSCTSEYLLDFHAEEKTFLCEFSAQKTEISKKQIEFLTEKLRENKLLI